MVYPYSDYNSPNDPLTRAYYTSGRPRPSSYNPYAGAGDFAGMQMTGAPALPPMPLAKMPEFDLQRAMYGQDIAGARRSAKGARAEAGQGHAQNISSIGANTMERGIAFSGAHTKLNQKENEVYTRQLASIAQALAQAQQAYSSNMMGLTAQNDAYRLSQGAPFYPGGQSPNANMAAILATIRSRESGGNYSAENPSSTASGAYQFTDPTWQGLLRQFGVAGPAHAASAGMGLQNLIATNYVRQILAQHGGNVSFVPQIWHWGGGGYQSHPWDAYDTSWLQLYRQLYGNQGYGGGGQRSQR